MDNCRDVFDPLGEAIVHFGRAPGETFQVLDANRAWERLFGRSRADLLKLPLKCIFPPSLAAELADACERCIASGETVQLQVHVPLATHLSNQAWTLLPMSAPNASMQRVVLLARTAVMETESLPSIVRFRNILEQTSDFIAHFDIEGRFLFFNTALKHVLQPHPAEVLGKTPLELWPHTQNTVRAHATLLEVVRTGESRELEIFNNWPGESPTCHQVRFAPERNDQGQVISVVAIGRDITSLKLAEEKLRQSEQQFRALAEHSPDCILRYDRALRLVYANPTLERFTGIPIKDFIGKEVAELRAVRRVPYDEGMVITMREALTQVFHDGTPIEFEICERNFHAHGGVLYFNFIVVPERGASGNIETVLAIGRDVTPLKAVEAELRALNATLEERVATRTMDLELANRDLESFAHTVSHDLRAPLRTIIGFATLLKQDEGIKLSERGRTLPERICTAGFKLNRLIDDILQYSHASRAPLTRRPVALDQLAQDVASELLVQYPHVSVKVADLPHVSGDPTMLRQIMQNLIGNALKFSAQHTRPRVEVNYLRQNGETVFYVRDNGAGFDMRYAEKLGALFQRLHHEREFPGSGVGLAIVQRLIERHGGRLWAESKPGAGATFFFTVPSSAGEVQPANEH